MLEIMKSITVVFQICGSSVHTDKVVSSMTLVHYVSHLFTAQKFIYQDEISIAINQTRMGETKCIASNA